MKQCNKCSVDLVLGDNWADCQKNSCDYRCKPCKIKITTKWNHKNPERRKQNNFKNCNSEGVGIYQIMLGEICMYIGEGQIKDRRKKHLQNNSSSSSAALRYCLKHNINRELLSFNVLELQDDTIHRKELEDWYITFLNPIINPTPPKKLFGDV